MYAVYTRHHCQGLPRSGDTLTNTEKQRVIQGFNQEISRLQSKIGSCRVRKQLQTLRCSAQKKIDFRNLQFNQALAIASFILVLNGLLTLAYLRIGRKYDYDA